MLCAERVIGEVGRAENFHWPHENSTKQSDNAEITKPSQATSLPRGEIPRDPLGVLETRHEQLNLARTSGNKMSKRAKRKKRRASCEFRDGGDEGKIRDGGA